MPTAPATNAPALVLDTNATLDWLVFQDTGMAAVSAAVQAGAVRWLACTRMRDELARTLSYPALAKWKPDSERTLSIFDLHATSMPTPAAAPLHLRCSDADDQVFLDLALAHQAGWLLTHDRALLRLARRARIHGLQITQPSHWRLK